MRETWVMRQMIWPRVRCWRGIKERKKWQETNVNETKQKIDVRCITDPVSYFFSPVQARPGSRTQTDRQTVCVTSQVMWRHLITIVTDNNYWSETRCAKDDERASERASEMKRNDQCGACNFYTHTHTHKLTRTNKETIIARSLTFFFYYFFFGFLQTKMKPKVESYRDYYIKSLII